MKNEIKKRVLRYFTKAASLAKKIQHTAEKNDIHDFRVEMKKLNALLNLVNTQQNKSLIIAVSPHLKEFYDLLGAVRQFQLQQEQVTKVCTEIKIPSPEKYLAYLVSEEKLYTDQLRRTEIDVKEMKKRIMQHLPKKLKKKVLIEYSGLRKDTLRQLCSMAPDDERMHKIRKLLKEILYNVNFLRSESIEDTTWDEKVLHHLSDELGDYQDLAVAQYSVWYYRTNHPENENENLVEMETLFGKKKLLMRDRILNDVQEKTGV